MPRTFLISVLAEVGSDMPHPSHPIMLPGMPGWGSGGPPLYPSQGPGFPTPPIVVPPGGAWPQPPQPPLGIWGPGDPRPTLPIAGWNPGTGAWPQPPTGQPPYPDHSLPPFPSHPIVVPPGGVWPDEQPHPEHPIVLPPQFPAVEGNKAHIVAYVPKEDGSGYERITFQIDLEGGLKPPTTPQPKAGAPAAPPMPKR